MKQHPPDALGRLLPLLSAELPAEEFAFLTGSAAEGLPFRDLDVAVQFTALTDPLGQCHELASRLERVTRVPVDVIPLEKVSLAFRHHASKGILLHCSDEERLALWREETWGRYLDMELHYRLATRALLRG